MVKKRVKKKVKGMRDGIDKKEIMASMDEQDWEKIYLEKKYKDVKNTNLAKCIVHCCPTYQQYYTATGLMETYLFNILDAKRYIDVNKKEILKGEISRCFPKTNIVMTERDLEIDNIRLNETISDNLSKLWNTITIIGQYIDVTRIDRYVFLTDEQFDKKFKRVENELKKQGIKLFQER